MQPDQRPAPPAAANLAVAEQWWAAPPAAPPGLTPHPPVQTSGSRWSGRPPRRCGAPAAGSRGHRGAAPPWCPRRSKRRGHRGQGVHSSPAGWAQSQTRGHAAPVSAGIRRQPMRTAWPAPARHPAPAGWGPGLRRSCFHTPQTRCGTAC